VATHFGKSCAVERHTSEGEARAAARLLWCAWVLYREEGHTYVEVISGGVGIGAHRAIRAYMGRLGALKTQAAEHAQGQGI